MILAQGKSCSHASTTLVQAATVIDYDTSIEPEAIWFACHQCDLCGSITQKEVTAEEVDLASEAPWLDEDFYLARMRELVEDTSEWTTLQFIAKATKR